MWRIMIQGTESTAITHIQRGTKRPLGKSKKITMKTEISPITAMNSTIRYPKGLSPSRKSSDLTSQLETGVVAIAKKASVTKSAIQSSDLRQKMIRLMSIEAMNMARLRV